MRTPLLVGVDVHQQQNVMSFLDLYGQAPRGVLRVANNRPGSEAFVEALTQVMASGGFDGIRVAADWLRTRRSLPASFTWDARYLSLRFLTRYRYHVVH